MYIRDRLYLGALISIIVVVIIVSVISLTSQEIAKKYREHDLVIDVKTDISELDIVTYEYLLHREKRMEQQWHLKYDSMREIIKEEELTEPIRADYVTLGNLFSQVTTNYKKRQRLIQEGASRAEIDASVLLEERLVAQLLIKSHSIMTSAFRLSKQVDTEIAKDQETANTLTLTLMLILAATVTTVSLVVARSISKPLDRLTKGAEIIGNGDLEHRIDVKSKDEVGKLATAFNQMTVQLGASEQQLRASNQQLQASEQQLRASNQQLQASEQQLRASNQQLRADEQQLRAEIAERKKLEEQTKKHLHDLEVFYKANIGREGRIVELKKEISRLKNELGRK
jgi:methyl-accepting chemotaxis protein